ncbi:transposase [Flavobacterium sp.]|uniref:transposase n=1 Tax=Flavobacterium sp. TaxID=239 RepID=UPI003528283D
MKLEILQKDKFYHIYNRGINGCNIFSLNENKSYFLKLVSKYLNDKVSILAFCLMDNHFHFVIQVTEDEKIVTQAFSNLFNAYAKAYNKQQNRTGSLFEKHFKRIELTSDEYLKNVIIYVHLNPYHHLNIDFVDFEFSSYQNIVNNSESLVNKFEVINLFDDVDNFKYCHNSKKRTLASKFTLE